MHRGDPASAMSELAQRVGISGQVDRQECPVFPIDSRVMAGLGEVEHRAVVRQAVPASFSRRMTSSSESTNGAFPSHQVATSSGRVRATRDPDV